MSENESTNIPKAAVEAAWSRVAHNFDDTEEESWKDEIRDALEAAAPYLLAEDRAEVWAEGHEDGFWNGRMSSGDPGDAALIGKEHADATNPYRSQG